MVKKYRPLFILRFLYWIVPLLQIMVAAFFVIVFSRIFSFQMKFLVALLCLYACLLLFDLFRNLQICLEIDDNGISFYNAIYTISTSWDNVERIGKRVSGNSNFPVEGLVLRTPCVIKMSMTAKLVILQYSLLTEMGYYESNYSRSIPLQGIWSWNWRKSELAEDLKHYLPHLF